MLPSAESLEGQPVPQVTFKARPDDQWRDITTDELFKGKTVVTLNFAVKDGATIIGAKFESTTPDRPRRNTMLFNLEDGTLSTEHPRQTDMFSPRAVAADRFSAAHRSRPRPLAVSARAAPAPLFSGAGS